MLGSVRGNQTLLDQTESTDEIKEGKRAGGWERTQWVRETLGDKRREPCEPGGTRRRGCQEGPLHSAHSVQRLEREPQHTSVAADERRRGGRRRGGTRPPSLCLGLLPAWAQKGTVPSLCTRCGPLKLYLYSNRRCGNPAAGSPPTPSPPTKRLSDSSKAQNSGRTLAWRPLRLDPAILDSGTRRRAGEGGARMAADGQQGAR